MKIGFFGDVVGRPGRRAVQKYLPRVRDDYQLDAVIINAENAAAGFGISKKCVDELYDAGADILTLGNHSFDNAQGIGLIEEDRHILRPCNYPQGSTPGRGAGLYNIGGFQLLVINVMGRVFMEPLDNPFHAVERELANAPLGEVADAIVVDIHAEASSEKNAMGVFCDGRASLVVGTHQHVPTADARILPGGTAYQSDAGMCGNYDSVIGMEKGEPLRRFTTSMRLGRNTPADGEGSLCGVIIETGTDGLATSITPIRMGGALGQT